MKIAVIGDEKFVLFFELAGAEGFEAKSREEVLSKLEELIEKEEYGVIIVPEKFVDATKELREKMMREGKAFPVIAFIPDFVKSPGDRIRDLKHSLIMAIGAEIKL